MLVKWRKLVKHTRLFGPGTAYREILKNRDYIFNAGIDIIPISRNAKQRHGASISPSDVTISVIIPVKNGGSDLAALLEKLRQQRGFKAIEIVIVDSGSTDDSRAIAARFGATIIDIAPEQFSHSYSRNSGAEQAKGEYLLFIVQDALPPSENWLHQLFTVMQPNDLAAVSCMETPRAGADLFQRATSWNFYKFLEVDQQDRVMRRPRQENPLTLRKNAQLSNVACLVRKDVFLKYRFRYDYAEDLDLGLRLLQDGHQLALLNSVRIIHSHNRSEYYHLKRGYVDALFSSKIIPGQPVTVLAPEALFQQIIAAYSFVDTLVHKELAIVKTPCQVKRLSRLIMKKLPRFIHVQSCSGDISGSNQYITPQFRIFIENMKMQYTRLNGHSTAGSGTTIKEALQNNIMIIFNYLDKTSRFIDKEMLKDFKSSLYKIHAQVAGAHLAASYAFGSEKNRERLQDIHEELTKGI